MPASEREGESVYKPVSVILLPINFIEYSSFLYNINCVLIIIREHSEKKNADMKEKERQKDF